MSVIVYGYDFERIFCPEVRSFGIRVFARWNDAFEPYCTPIHRESSRVAPNVFLAAIQNYATDSFIENLIEVSQQLGPIANLDDLVMNARLHRIGDQGCHCLTVILAKCRLEFAEEG